MGVSATCPSPPPAAPLPCLPSLSPAMAGSDWKWRRREGGPSSGWSCAPSNGGGGDRGGARESAAEQFWRPRRGGGTQAMLRGRREGGQAPPLARWRPPRARCLRGKRSAGAPLCDGGGRRVLATAWLSRPIPFLTSGCEWRCRRGMRRRRQARLSCASGLGCWACFFPPFYNLS